MKHLLTIFLLTLNFSLPSAIAQSASEEDKQLAKECPAFVETEKQLDDWMIPAIANPYGIGCPTKAVYLALTKLEKMGVENSDTICGGKAISLAAAFYSIFTEHLNYAMCGLDKKQNLFSAKITKDFEVCADSTAEKISNCFLDIMMIISFLKINGEMEAAFELSRKTANSNDVTGFSQMALGGAYLWGNGTNKDVPLAIKWYKESLERLNEKNMRINSMIALSVAYEEIGDYKNARKYSQQCAALGDKDCKKMLIRIEGL